MKVVLYSTGCPKCHVLKAKLDTAGVEYETVSDTEIMLQKGFLQVPVLEVEGEALDFLAAVNWIKGLNKGE